MKKVNPNDPPSLCVGELCPGCEYCGKEHTSEGWPKCRICGCTDEDCRLCIARTGQPCHWVEEDLCSACTDAARLLHLVKQIKEATLAIGELLDNRYVGDPVVQIQNEIKRKQLFAAREAIIKDLVALVLERNK